MPRLWAMILHRLLDAEHLAAVFQQRAPRVDHQQKRPVMLRVRGRAARRGLCFAFAHSHKNPPYNVIQLLATTSASSNSASKTAARRCQPGFARSRSSTQQPRVKRRRGGQPPGAGRAAHRALVAQQVDGSQKQRRPQRRRGRRGVHQRVRRKDHQHGAEQKPVPERKHRQVVAVLPADAGQFQQVAGRHPPAASAAAANLARVESPPRK